MSRQSERWRFFFRSRNVLCRLYYIWLLSRSTKQSKLSAWLFVFASQILCWRYYNAVRIEVSIIPKNVLRVWHRPSLQFGLSFNDNERLKDIKVCRLVSFWNILRRNVGLLCEQMSIRLLDREDLVRRWNSGDSKMRVTMPQSIILRRRQRSVMCSNMLIEPV